MGVLYSSLCLLATFLHWALWLLFHFACGILGLGNRSLSALSWLLVVVAFWMYCDSQHRGWWCLRLPGPVLEYSRRRWARHRLLHCQSHALYSQVILDNQTNEHRETEPLNRQLEEENRENENEENSLVEADMQRIDTENRINVARENVSHLYQARIENHQNVERERQNTETILENQRNQTRENNRHLIQQRLRQFFEQRFNMGSGTNGAFQIHRNNTQTVHDSEGNVNPNTSGARRRGLLRPSSTEHRSDRSQHETGHRVSLSLRNREGGSNWRLFQ